MDPGVSEYDSHSALLDGVVITQIGHDDVDKPVLVLHVELNRSSSDAARLRWNRQMEFPEYEWMSKVRVWDENEQWIWPNLPFLLTAYGEQRQQRYGGVDPGKNVDNDFAAVLVRKDSVNKDFADRETFIRAGWNAPPGKPTNKRSIVHRAISDDVRIGLEDETSGSMHVWIIYADFMDAPLPAKWPSTKEMEGGILSYFQILWERVDSGLMISAVECRRPTETTGFNWDQWDKNGRPRS